MGVRTGEDGAVSKDCAAGWLISVDELAPISTGHLGLTKEA
jgi:hypothetical protein